MLLGLAATLLAATAAHAQRAKQPQWLPPHLGYVYPAGGRQGTTVEVTAGGQFLRDVSGVHVYGEGLQVTVGKYSRPISAEEFFRLQDKFKEVRSRFQAERAKTAMSELRGLYQKIMRDLGVNEDDLKAMREFAANATNPKRQFNFQIAEMVGLQIKIAPNAPPGERELRVITAAGLSNPLRFYVGQWPEVRKAPPSDTPTASEVRESLPVVLNGQILAGGGADRFAFHARKGARLLAVASARELMPYLADAVPGWFQAVLTLYDPQGNEVAYADDYRFQPDPVLHYQVPADGRYVLEIKDALYRGRTDFVYRVTLGELPFVTGVFPLGARDGARPTVEIRGWNLPADTLTLGTSERGPGIYPVSLHSGGSSSSSVSPRIPFARDVLPECLEQEPNDRPQSAQRITLPIVLNGRVDRPGDWDVFSFDGRAGAEVVAEVFARRLGSPLDSVLKLIDAAGTLVAVNDDYEDKGAALLTHHADSRLSAKLPATGTYYLYLGDTQHNGGRDYAYRLRVAPPRPDFELRVVPSSITARAGTAAPLTVYALRRDGFDGEIALELAGAPAGFVVNSGVLPAHEDKVRLTLTLPPTHFEKPLAVTLQGRALVQGRKTIRPAVPAEDMLQAFAYHQLVPAKELLVASIERRYANIWWRLASEQRVKLPVGGSARVQFLMPGGAMVNQMQLSLSDPPEGISIQSVMPAHDGASILLRAESGKVKAGLQGNLIIEASIERPIEPGTQSKAPGGKLRIPIGTLPAVPFQIVGP